MITDKPFKNVDDTVWHIVMMIKKHKSEPLLKYFEGKTAQEIFDYISKKVEYLKDPMGVPFMDNANIELLRSPKQTMLGSAGDCDCKTILAGALFERYNIPYRIAISSNKEDKRFHHVYPEINLNGDWKTFDATYDYNKIFEEKPYTRKRVYYVTPQEILKEEIKA